MWNSLLFVKADSYDWREIASEKLLRLGMHPNGGGTVKKHVG
jgi:hypothetical protein